MASEEDTHIVVPEDRDWQLDRTLAECMLEMYKRQLWTDVTFTFPAQDSNKDGSFTLKAHRIVLAARSPVFQAMFYGPCADGASIVELTEVDRDIMDLFLMFLYSDDSDLNLEMAPRLLKLAHTYQVPSAVKFCSEYIIKGLSGDNACRFLDLALFYEIPELRDAACRVIDEHAEHALNSDSFLQVSDECLTYILKGDTLNTDETRILERAILWSKTKCQKLGIENADDQTLRKTLGEAFYYLRVPSLDFKSFAECTRQLNFYTITEYKELVGQIAGLEVLDENINLKRSRLPLFETAVFDSDLFQEKQVQSSIVQCSFLISPKRAFYLVGFVVEHCTIRQSYFSYDFIPDLQKQIVCTATIDNPNYKQIFKSVLKPVFFRPPVKITKIANLSIEIDFSWLFAYGSSVSTYTKGSGSDRHGIRISTLTSDKELSSPSFGTIKLRTGDCFIKAFYVKNFPRRETRSCEERATAETVK